MALQSQTTNPIAEFGALVRRHLWGILLPFAFVTAFGVMIAELMPRRYEVATSIKVPEGGGDIQRDVSSAKNDMVAEPLVRSVIESQEWPDYVGLTDKEKLDYVRRVIKNTKVNVASISKNSVGSNYITVLYYDAEGTRAERFLNALRDRYIESVVAAARADARERRDKYKDLRQTQEDAYRAAEKAKADLIKEKGLSSLATPGGGQARGEDPIYTRLNQNLSLKADAERQLKEEEAKLEVTQHFRDNEPDKIPETEAAAIVSAGAKAAPIDEKAKEIAGLEMGILEKREKLKDYRPPASTYKRLEDEIERDQAKISALKGENEPNGTKSGGPRFVTNPKLAGYDQQISDSKTKIAGLKVTISSLAASIADLNRDHLQRQDWYVQVTYLDQAVARAMESYQTVDAAYTTQCMKVAMLDGPLANPYEVTETAKASDVPNAPNVPLFILISALLGLAVGFGWALTSEFLGNGFRGIPDLTRGLATPVLGAVNQITTRAQARRRMTRHIMIASSSAVIVGAILWITWAEQHDPIGLLGPRLSQLIEDVRMAFRP